LARLPPDRRRPCRSYWHIGCDNPNISPIQQVKKAGVDFRVCGQTVLAHKVQPKTIQPGIELNLWALTTLVNLELRGYVHVGAN
jgi:intracellular sulfur oxidation DsrE/DsrF family protein